MLYLHDNNPNVSHALDITEVCQSSYIVSRLAQRPCVGEGGHRVCGTGPALSRLHRAKVIGAPTDEQIRTAETMIRIQDEQFRTMRPGECARDVDCVVREGMLAAGLRDSYTGITGYTLGLKCPPRTSDFTRVFLADSDWQLEENRVFHMYTSARALPFSETVVVRVRLIMSIDG
jgi:hypothetical protein